MNHIEKYLGKSRVLILVLLLSVPAAAPRAQNLDPFQADGVWKSFDRYKEEQKEEFFSKATGDLKSDTDTASAGTVAASSERAAAKQDSDKGVSVSLDFAPHTIAGSKVPEPSELALAPPDRPVDPPVLPSMAVSGSGSGGNTLPPARIANMDSDPDLLLPKQNWLDAGEAARLHAEGKDSETIIPVNVRLSFLPGFDFATLKPKAKPVALAVAKPPPPPVPPAAHAADAAACAAIDAYKKRQLDAIESDRHTLSALQAAISELGLNKQLGYIAGDAKMDMPAEGGAAPPVSP